MSTRKAKTKPASKAFKAADVARAIMMDDEYRGFSKGKALILAEIIGRAFLKMGLRALSNAGPVEFDIGNGHVMLVTVKKVA